MMLPGLLNRWGWPVLICTAAAALCAVWAPASGRLPTQFLVMASAIAVILVAAAVLGEAPVSQILGRAPRYEGLALWVTFGAAAWIGARVVAFGGARSIRRAADAWSGAAVALGAIALIEATGRRPIATDVDRPGSLAGNATDQGLLGVAFAVLLCAGLLSELRTGGRIRRWHLVGVAGALAAVVTSASRAAYVALLVGVVALGLVHVHRSAHRARDAALIAGGLGVLALTLQAVPAVRERAFFTPGSLASATISDRLVMWRQAMDMLADHPWTGVGPSGFMDAVTPYFDDGWFQRADVGSVLDSPHNIVMQAAVCAGVPGLLAALALLGLVAATAVGRIRGAGEPRRGLLLGAAIATSAVGLGLLTHVSSPKTTVLLATLIGVLVATPPSVGPRQVGPAVAPRRARQTSRWAWTAVVAAWMATLIVWTAADGYLLTGMTRAASGEAAGAQRAFATAQILRPWDADVPLRAAEALGGAVDGGHAEAVQPALEWAQDAARRLPGSARAHQAWGMIALSSGDPMTAVEHLGVASRLSPADPRLHHELGLTRATVGDLQGAREEFERAAELAPDSLPTWRALEQVCLTQADQMCADAARKGAESAS